MQELIWYAIPGGVCLSAVLIVFPGLLADNQTLLVVGAPVTGFVIHQLTRLIFELLGGWHCRWRPVVKEISDAESIPDGRDGRYHAWVIWETTFYSNCVPDSFRDRDRRAWHYVLSFWSVAIAALFSCALLLWAIATGVTISHSAAWLLSFTLVFVLFVAKGWLTVSDVCKLEIAFFRRNRDQFHDAAISIPFGPNDRKANKSVQVTQ